MDTRTRTHAPPIVVSIAEAARLLGVSRQTIYDMHGRGQFRIVKLGDTTRSGVVYSDLIAMVENGQQLSEMK